MPPCQGIKANRQPCGKNATRSATDTHPDGLHLCGTHKNSYTRTVNLETAHVHYTPGQCFCTVRGWGGAPLRRVTTWCPNDAAAGAPYCATHETRRQQWLVRHVNNNQAQVDREVLNNFMVAAGAQALTWQDVVDVMVVTPGSLVLRRRVARRYYQSALTRAMEHPRWAGAPLWRFNEYWRWTALGQHGPAPNLDAVPVTPPPPPPPRQQALGLLARDTQNVHTRAVTDQTNSATEKLLAVKVPEAQQTEKTMAAVWLGHMNVSYSTFLRVANDVNRWFATKDCRTTDDNLYRKLLRGLVAMIAGEKDDERKTEMYRRLWEECCEATGMCCEGHISRLCNVLVGFDDAFKPPVAFGELLQSKMSAIAGIDASEEEKRRQANAFFDEYGTPAEERAAWLEAF